MIRATKKTVGLVLGPAFFFGVMHVQPFDQLGGTAHATLGLTLWMAIWWILDIVPMAITALLPIAVMPLVDILPIGDVTSSYGDPVIFLYMGGFIIAIAMERWGLHRRIALNILNVIGGSASRVILGFMIATGLLSMWISNTATTLMMVTIASALIGSNGHQDHSAIQKPLLLGIAYAASICGVATPVGTPTNPVFVAVAMDQFGMEVSFAKWMMFALPFSVIMLLVAWAYLTRVAYNTGHLQFPMGDHAIQDQLRKLGPMGVEERAVMIVFGITALCWISRPFLLDQWMPGINDTIIVTIAVLILFLLPTGTGHLGLLSWEDAVKLPWGVMILFGGGLALAAAFRTTGLAEWIGLQMQGLSGLHTFLIILVISLVVNFLTEVTSNVATTSIILPVLAALSGILNVHPFLLMVPATMAASCAFMLPVATPPNAIVFASGKLKIRDMAGAGFMLNLVSSVVVAAVCYVFVEGLF